MFANSFKTVVILALALLGGCSKNFVVTSDVPRPLIDPIPAVASLQLNDEFRNYEYVETSDERALEVVQFGAAQTGMFEQVFGTLFTLAGSSEEQVDLKIQPEILDFQYSVPAETKLKLYEIWVKYRLRITDHADKEIADWVVKGYGKTPTSMLGSQTAAFNTASNVALRDVGAQLAIGFRTQPAIEEFLANLGKTERTSGAVAEQLPAEALQESALEESEGLDESQESDDAEQSPQLDAPLPDPQADSTTTELVAVDPRDQSELEE